jgi:hypothetical protein
MGRPLARPESRVGFTVDRVNIRIKMIIIIVLKPDSEIEYRQNPCHKSGESI